MRWLFGSSRKTQQEPEQKAATHSPFEPKSERVIDPSPTQNTPNSNWLGRLTAGLARTSSRLGSGIGAIFLNTKLDNETLEKLEDLLITADLGVTTAAKITANLAKTRMGKDVTETEIKEALAAEITTILRPIAVPFKTLGLHPQTVLFVGANGSGKTTTIGKFAKDFTDKGAKVILAAGDTFRAAASEQLKIWGQRTGAPVIAKSTGADPAGLAFDALKQASQNQADLLLIDTAGRLHNRVELMDELAKIVRVLKKQDESGPHNVLLILDATIGQNALAQVRVFLDAVQVTGLIVTKLDGTAKGGVVVALAEAYGLPVHAIGVGESAEDLRPFDADEFARALVGLENTA